MKHICSWLALCLAALPVYARFYPYPFDNPSYALREIATPHFRIIFTENSRFEAAQVASFAEEEFQGLQKSYGVLTNIGGPIRVVVSKDDYQPNGLATPVPVPTIRLYLGRKPASYSSIGNFGPDTIRIMFRHELTHIYTLSLIDKNFARMGYIFGNILYPNVFFASSSLMEGATIQRESDTGYGRLNDPYTHFLLRRDFYSKKGRLRSPAATSGADPSFGTGHLPYTYGGLFYDYLVQNFTPSFDRQIWQQLSRLKTSADAVPYAIKEDKSQRTRTLESLWADFEAYHLGLLPPLLIAQPLLSSKKRSIHSLTLRSNNLYYYNSHSRQIRRINLTTGRDSFVLYGLSGWNKVHISPDESLALVSGTVLKKSRSKNYTAVINLKNGLTVQGPIYGFAEASFAPDASSQKIAYTALHLGKTNALIYRENNKEFPLLYAAEGFSFDSPVMHRSHIYFVASIKGERFLMRMLADGTKIESLSAPVRYVRAPVDSPEGLSFSYTESSTGLYKTGYIRGNTLHLVKDNVKGEMIEAAVRGSTVYALGGFGDSDNILAVNSPATEVSAVRFQPFTPPVPSNAALNPLAGVPVKPYFQIRDMAPYFWLPYVSLREAGFMLQMFDPVGADAISLIMGISYERAVPQFRFTWEHSSLPVDISFTVFNLYSGNGRFPHHIVSSGLFLSMPLQSALHGGGSVGASLSWVGRYTGNISRHPYTWHSSAYQQFIYGAHFTWAQTVSEGKPYFSRSLGFTLRAAADALHPALWRIESALKFSPPIIPLFVSFYYTYDTSGALPSGESLLGLSLIPRYNEYAKLTIPSLWAVFASAELLIIPGEINKGAGMGEVFLQSINLFGGYRVGYWQALGSLQSVYARLDISLSIFYGKLALTLGQEFAYGISLNAFSYNFNLGAALPF